MLIAFGAPGIKSGLPKQRIRIMKKFPLIAFILGLCVLLGSMLFYRQQNSTRPVAPKTNASPTTDDSSGGTTRSKRPILRRSEEGTAASFRSDLDLLKTALEQKDHYNMEALLIKLSQDLKDHPEHLNDILQRLRTETDPTFLAYLTKVIEGGDALANKAVTETALDIAQNDSVSARRHAGLSLLEEVPEITPETAEQVNQISRQASDVLVRTSALATMTSWISDHPQMGPNLAQEMLKTVNASDNLEVRANGLLFVAAHIAELPENFTPTIAEYLHDSSHYLRTTAAEALGKAPETMKSFVLPELEKALLTETDLMAQRALLAAIIRAGKSDAAGILQRLSSSPAISSEVQEYQRIIAGGTTDPDEIIKQKLDLEMAREPVVENKHKD